MRTSLLLIIVSILSIGCSGKATKEISCSYPDAPEESAPTWLCNQPIAEAKVTAIGSARKSKLGHSFMLQMAATDARVQLAQQASVEVSNMIKQYAETTGTADTETVDLVNTSVTKQITRETLVGSKIYRSQVSPNGMLYVLVGLDPESVSKVARNAISTSMKNEQALWQQFKAKMAMEELAAEISESNLD